MPRRIRSTLRYWFLSAAMANRELETRACGVGPDWLHLTNSHASDIRTLTNLGGGSINTGQLRATIDNSPAIVYDVPARNRYTIYRVLVKGGYTMTTQDNKSVVRRLDEFLNKGDLAVADELFAPYFINHNPGRGMTPDREGLKQYITAIRTAFPDVNIIADDLICEGDKVVVRVTISGTHRGDFAGIPPTGKEVSVMGISILRLAEGKIVERWNVSDELGLLQQLGIIPSMG